MLEREDRIQHLPLLPMVLAYTDVSVKHAIKLIRQKRWTVRDTEQRRMYMCCSPRVESRLGPKTSMLVL